MFLPLHFNHIVDSHFFGIIQEKNLHRAERDVKKMKVELKKYREQIVELHSTTKDTNNPWKEKYQQANMEIEKLHGKQNLLLLLS